MKVVSSITSFAAKTRLLQLLERADGTTSGDSAPGAPPSLHGALTGLDDRLGRAGYFSPSARSRATRTRLFVVTGPAAILSAELLRHSGFGRPGLLLFAAITGLAGGFLLWNIFLRFRERNLEREIMFRLPLFLESVILVVEAGTAVLPALQNVIARRDIVSTDDPVAHIFAIAYRLASRGLPLEQALETTAAHVGCRPLRHVLLHLDISANVGGELVPSLRSLSDHAHLEWKLAVEKRVRRLENFVVFPVFASVIGLILLTAAVPLIPLLQLHSSLGAKHELHLKLDGGSR